MTFLSLFTWEIAMRYIVIGNGIGGITAARELVKNSSPDSTVLIFSIEDSCACRRWQAFYNWVGSADYIAGITCAPVLRTAPRRLEEDLPLKRDLLDFMDLAQRVLGTIEI